MAARYVAGVNGGVDGQGPPKWAIAGRHEDKLRELSRNLTAQGGTEPTVLVADLSDGLALVALASRARAVMSYAGPYHSYGGENLIAAALAGCAHYVDLCGEPKFKADMLEKYHGAAQTRGVAIVQAMGMDSMPSDLLAARSSEMLVAGGGGPPTDVTVFWSTVNSFLSGGTLASGEDDTSRASAPQDGRGLAYALAPDTPDAARVDVDPAGTPPHSGPTTMGWGYDANFSMSTGQYVMAGVDGPTVRRTLTTMYPNQPIHFAEVMGQSVLDGWKQFFSNPKMLSDPPNFIPQPGQGPPQWMLEAGSVAGQGLAARGAGPGAAPSQARLSMACRGDPGYKDTAMWSAQFALLLSAKGLKQTGGYLTPVLAAGTDELMAMLSGIDGGLCSFWEGNGTSQ